jgi:hypothetical protein
VVAVRTPASSYILAVLVSNHFQNSYGVKNAEDNPVENIGHYRVLEKIFFILMSCSCQGSTHSNHTGPSSARSGSSYLYAETSSPVPDGNKFIFETPPIQGDIK